MSIEENKALIRTYFEAINAKEKPPKIIDKFVDDKQLKGFILESEVGFPKFELIIEDMICEGDKVVVRVMFNGLNTGHFGELPPTNKKLSQSMIVIYQVEDGKIVDHWMEINRLEVMEKLGVIPESPTVPAYQ
jgi:predicted ester cyclase